jgi:hypothetical protein
MFLLYWLVGDEKIAGGGGSVVIVPFDMAMLFSP